MGIFLYLNIKLFKRSSPSQNVYSHYFWCRKFFSFYFLSFPAGVDLQSAPHNSGFAIRFQFISVCILKNFTLIGRGILPSFQYNLNHYNITCQLFAMKK